MSILTQTSGRGRGVRLFDQLRAIDRRWLFFGIAALLLVFITGEMRWTDLGSAAGRIGPGALALAAAALVVNMLGGWLRMRRLLTDFGFTVSWITSARAAFYGTIAGIVFFQLVGQLLTRAAVLRRAGVSPAATVVLSFYERLISMLVLAGIAATGAVYLFGHVSVDLQGGGADLVRLCIALLIAATSGAAFGYSAVARRAIIWLRRRGPLTRIVRAGLITFAMQLMMLSAYVILGREIASGASLQDLAAASAVVMLAASLPISFGGWGVRELSAVYAYGAIGIGTADALIISIVLGGMSQLLAAVGAGVAASVGRADTARGVGAEVPVPVPAVSVDYFTLIAWAVPLAAATAVFFQVPVPVDGGEISLNLADPIVVIGGFACVAGWWMHRATLGRWRLGPSADAALIAFTVAITLAFLYGTIRNGLNDWALLNRFTGWFVLVGYALTGALVTWQCGPRGTAILLRTVVVAGAAMMVSDSLFQALEGTSLGLGRMPDRMQAMSSNPNAFGFQMLIAASIMMAFAGRPGFANPRMVYAAISGFVVAAIWLSGSRASIGGFAIVAVVALLLGFVRVAAVVRLIGLAAVPVLLFYVPDPAIGLRVVGAAPETVIEGDVERWQSIADGFRLWLDHPLLGAGLGAFHAGSIAATGKPLVIHSTPVWILAEFGLIGAMILLGPVLWVAHRLRSSWREEPLDPAIRAAILVGVAMVVEFAVHDMLYQRLFWLVIGACLALPRTAGSAAEHVAVDRSWPGGADGGYNRPFRCN